MDKENLHLMEMYDIIDIISESGSQEKVETEMFRQAGEELPPLFSCALGRVK
jgi:hypothetical protein